MSTVSDYFGSLVFDDRVMKAMLSADVYQSLKKTIDEGASLNNDVANAVAAATGRHRRFPRSHTDTPEPLCSGCPDG